MSVESSGFGVLDIAILVVVLLSGILALLRGFVHEVLSFGAWVGAALVTLYAFPYAQPYVRDLISIQLIADVLCGVAIFLVSLIILSLIARGIARGVQGSSLSALDRTLGLLFGFVRGAVIISLAWIVFAWLIPEPDQPGWVKEARALPMVKQGADFLRSLVPDSFRQSVEEAAGRNLELAPQPLATSPGLGLDSPLQPQPEGTSPGSQPAYGEQERDQLDKTIEDVLDGGGTPPKGKQQP